MFQGGAVALLGPPLGVCASTLKARSLGPPGQRRFPGMWACGLSMTL